MAKAQKTSRRRRTATRRPGARPGSRGVARGKIDLGPLHSRLTAHVGRLQRVQQTPEIKNALRRLTRCLDEIQSSCGPTMLIPLG